MASSTPAIRLAESTTQRKLAPMNRTLHISLPGEVKRDAVACARRKNKKLSDWLLLAIQNEIEREGRAEPVLDRTIPEQTR